MSAVNKEMKERRKKLNQIAKEFDISIIYTFGSNVKAVAEWLGCERFEL